VAQDTDTFVTFAPFTVPEPFDTVQNRLAGCAAIVTLYGVPVARWFGKTNELEDTEAVPAFVSVREMVPARLVIEPPIV
jgi:hypothetical protein